MITLNDDHIANSHVLSWAIPTIKRDCRHLLTPSHQSSVQHQALGEVALTTSDKYPTPDTRRGCIHNTRAVSNARHMERMYPSHQSSISRQTLGEDVSISPEQYLTPDTRRGCIHLTRAVSNARHMERMYPSHQSSI
ncbi:hypothetical protein ElyMa_001689600 [Elysia marginata]|uniref:Uncharacterized protein n=1 Tax=Elysia marginata TaxID=1093978 RepID=A0AAV4JSZ5_9GAST|nr:hypothetical protein ElyMa_001689600 [Elysia marginata]